MKFKLTIAKLSPFSMLINNLYAMNFDLSPETSPSIDRSYDFEKY